METIGTYEADNLIAGDFPRVTTTLVVAESQTIKRGAGIGIVTIGGQAKIVDATATTGEEVLEAIAAEDATTGAGETKTITGYLTGEFNENSITVGSGAVADYKAAARNKGIFFKKAIAQ